MYKLLHRPYIHAKGVLTNLRKKIHTNSKDGFKIDSVDSVKSITYVYVSTQWDHTHNFELCNSGLLNSLMLNNNPYILVFSYGNDK